VSRFLWDTVYNQNSNA